MNTLKHIHINKNSQNLYFEILDQIICINYSTPYSNDYCEWRFYSLSIEKKTEDIDYTALTPLKIRDLQISDNELEFIKIFSCEESDGFHYITYENNKKNEDKVLPKIESIQEYMINNPEVINPLSYLDYTILTSVWYEDDPEITHHIYKYGKEKDNLPCNVLDQSLFLSKYEYKKNIMEYQGLYNLLIPIMNDFILDY